MRFDVGWGWSLFRVELKEKLDERLSFVVKAGRVFEVALENPLERQVVCGASEWGLASEDLKDDTTKCPDVGAEMSVVIRGSSQNPLASLTQEQLARSSGLQVKQSRQTRQKIASSPRQDQSPCRDRGSWHFRNR